MRDPSAVTAEANASRRTAHRRETDLLVGNGAALEAHLIGANVDRRPSGARGPERDERVARIVAAEQLELQGDGVLPRLRLEADVASLDGNVEQVPLATVVR